MSKTIKRLVLYVVGLFLLSLGISLSIQAGLGVSPVSSLAYAISLITGVSVGITTVAANILYFFIQVLLKKRFELKQFVIQIVMASLFGLFINVTLMLVRHLPAPETIIARIIYLVVSLFVVASGLLGYFSSKFPLMPYDGLTYVISERFNLKFSKAKITCDMTNVCISGALCLIFVHAFGSIGIGTFVAAYFIGKILGWLIKRYQQTLLRWAFLAEPPKPEVPVQSQGERTAAH